MMSKTDFFNNLSNDLESLSLNDILKRGKILQREIDRQKDKIENCRNWFVIILGGALSLCLAQEIQKVTVAIIVLVISYGYLLRLEMKLYELEFNQKELLNQLELNNRLEK